MDPSSSDLPQGHGILLVNLGTPDSPAVGDVRRYLAEFLSDPLVIDLPTPARVALVRGVILPFRPRRSAAAYRKIWTDRGSPLRFHGEDLAALLRERTGRPVALGMRYGNPGIGAGLDRLRAEGVAHVHIVALFPQFSESAWGTAVQAAEAAARERGLPVTVLPPFYRDPTYLEALVSHTGAFLAAHPVDRVLMSFHGVPERHVRKTDRSPGRDHCLRAGCCAEVGEANRDCYRAHCYATARGLAAGLGLGPERYEVAFQSRLGRTPWLRPYTDERIRALAAGGCRRLAIVCPAFVADCLETLEEIGMAGRESFLEHGGEELLLVPALNAAPAWATALAAMVAGQPAAV